MQQMNTITIHEYSISHAPLSSFVDVKNFVNGENFHVVQIEKGTEIHSKICLTKTLDKIIEDPKVIYKTKNEVDSDNYIWLVKSEFLNNLSQFGWHLSRYLREIEGSPEYDVLKGVSKNVLKDFSNPEYQFIQYVPNEHNQQCYKNSKNEYFMSPFLLDYINGRIENETYLLDDFVENLSHRDDIAFMANMDRWTKKKIKLLHCPLKGDEEDIGGIISDIQHNLEEGDTRPIESEEVHLVYYPKKQDIERILKWSQRVDAYTPEGKKWRTFSIQTFIVQDILGGKQFYKDPPKDEVETPKRKFKH